MELIDVTPDDSIVPVYVEKLTAKQLAEREAEREAQAAQAKAEADAKLAARESALAKLAALGLTQDEIDAL
jgi:DNA-binding NarL/FixJ family response regulator